MIIYAWIGYYNFARIYMPLGRPPNPLPGKTELERLSKIIFIKKRCLVDSTENWGLILKGKL